MALSYGSPKGVFPQRLRGLSLQVGLKYPLMSALEGAMVFDTPQKVLSPPSVAPSLRVL